MRPDKLILATTASLLDVTATTIRTASAVTDRLARALQPAPQQPPPPPSERRTGGPRQPPAPTAQVGQRPTFHHVEHDVDDLVRRPAAEVIATLPALSDTELGDLYEREASGRRRRSVLDALTEVTAPSPDSAGPEDEIEIPDTADLVYSTETSS